MKNFNLGVPLIFTKENLPKSKFLFILLQFAIIYCFDNEILKANCATENKLAFCS